MAHLDRDQSPVTLTALLAHRAARQPDELAFAFLSDGQSVRERMTYRDLDAAARMIAGLLKADDVRGEPVLLLYAPGLDYIAAFFGCLYAGAIAVPAYPPHRNRSLDRLISIVRDSGARVVLCSEAVRDSIQHGSTAAAELQGLHWIATDQPRNGVEPFFPKDSADPSTIAFLQYTSGSTSAPRGVMLSHGNLFHNARLITEGFQLGRDSVSVFWLPLYHDMGLIGGVLQPMQIGRPSYLMAPATFLSQPMRWLEAISKYRATISGAPNFAYELCASKATPEQVASLDLSKWRVAFNGAEPVRADTLARFESVFAPAGFQSVAAYPCYGLAESTLIVTGGRHDHQPVTLTVSRPALEQHRIEVVPADHPESRTIVGCGGPLLDQRVVVVEPESCRPCPPDQPGEVWIAGPSVAQGYWHRPELSAATFQARTADGEGPYLRTGDLGFLHDGELFITGRIKDLIILRGRNHYPQDIEQSVERSHPAIRPACCAAFAVEDGHGEKLVVVAEIERSERKAPLVEIAKAVRRAIAEHHEVMLDSLVLLKPGSVPKTSSGKIQRHACKAGFLAGTLTIVGRWDAANERVSSVKAEPPSKTSASTASPQCAAIRDWLCDRIAVKLRLDPATIDPREPLAALGLDSLTAVQLAGELENWLQRPISPVLVYDHPTIDALARFLSGDEASATAGEPAAASADKLDDRGIAIIGLGCRFPGADGPAEFWKLLAHGGDAIQEVPADRWNVDDVYSADPTAAGKMTTKFGGFLREVDRFDRAFFGIAPREAERMDPQQRALLEVAFEALEDAGQDAERLAGRPVGVFVGISSNDYGRLQMGDPAEVDAYVGTGNALSIAANRISYAFDFRGPSMAVDTACSSSLVAVHLACQSLLRGEARLAVAGGVNLILTPDLTINFSRANMMAPDGRCKAFDAAADGYVRAEGVGVVVLKPMAQALADGDRIYAVIRGSAINQDGRSNGLTAPNRQSQEAVLRQAYAAAEVSPGEIDAIEAHGTGTALGDPIEALALGQVLAEGRPANCPAWLGSVKTNIGHAEAAAGVAGLIKMALALHHGELPPSLHFHSANPHIPFEQLPLRVVTELQPWRQRGRPALAGVSSFGFGGTNAHIVLQGVEESPAQVTNDSAVHLIPLSARSPEALRDLARRWIDHGESHEASLTDLAFSASSRRTHHDYRLTVAARRPKTFHDALQAFLNGVTRRELSVGRRLLNREPRIAFVYAGQSSQWWGMGRDLLASEPVFRNAIEQCDALFAPMAGWSLVSLLRNENDAARLDDTACVQPAIFALQVGLTELYRSWGILPSLVAGHSLGEVAAAYACGALTMDDAMRVVWHRARLQHETRGGGKMAAVGLSAEESAAALVGCEDRLALAAINGPHSTVWSGDPSALEEALQPLRVRDIFCRVLRGQVAFHSPQMEPLKSRLIAALQGIAPRPSTVPFVSTVTGRIEAGDTLTPDYWSRNLREPVQFESAMVTVLDHGIDAVIELGPHPVLAEPCEQIKKSRSVRVPVLPSLRRSEEGRVTLLESVGTLYTLGAPVSWPALEPAGQFVALPSYPWQRERCWREAKHPRLIAAAPGQNGQIRAVRKPSADDRWMVRSTWQEIVKPDLAPSLAGNWLVAGNSRPAIERVAALLSEKHAAVKTIEFGEGFDSVDSRHFTIDAANPEDWRRVVRAAVPSGGSLRGIIFLQTTAPTNEGLTSGDLSAAQDRGAIGALHLVQALAHYGATPRLWLVTRAAQPVEAGDPSAVASAPLWGFGRVIAREHPELQTMLVDLDPTPQARDWSDLVQMLGASNVDDQLAWRRGRLYAARLVNGAERLPNESPKIRSDATYLLTGGLGGLGLAVADWLVQQGARHLVLASRRGETPETQPAIAALRQRGATVHVAKADAADRAQLAALFADIDMAMPPLAGVMHLAGVLDDGIALHLNRERFQKVLWPKLHGAWNLHVLTAGRRLDHFVLFSSVASILGSPGQSSYAAGNAFLDALAQHRRSRGLPAISLNWGPWAEVGMAARDNRESRLGATGMQSLPPETGLSILGRALTSPEPQLGIVPIEPATWKRFAPGGQAPPYLAGLIGADDAYEKPGAEVASALDRSALLAAPTDQWQAILESQLREQAARVLKLAAGELDVEQPLSNLGIDSLMAIELKNRIEADLGATVPMVKFLEGPSVRDLSAYLAEQLQPLLMPLRAAAAVERNGHSGVNGSTHANGHATNHGHAAAGNGASSLHASQILAQIDSLSDAEVDSLLQELCDAEKGD